MSDERKGKNKDTVGSMEDASAHLGSYQALGDIPLMNTTGYHSLGERTKKRWIIGIVLTLVSVLLIALAVAFLTNAFHNRVQHQGEHRERVHAAGIFYYIGASISILCTCYVVVSYILAPGARQHPGSLVLWGSVSDLVFAIVIVIGHLWDGLLELGDHACLIPAFFVQFSILAGITWFFMLSVDLYLSLTRPFSDPQNNLKFYHIFVWGTSLLSAILLVTSNHYGQSAFAVCWVKESEGDTQLINWWNWIMFNIPWLAYFSLSIIALLYTRSLFKSGMLHSQRARERVFRTTYQHVMWYGIYYLVAGVLYWALYFDSYESDALLKAFALIISMRGGLDALTWHYKINRANDRLTEEDRAIDAMLRTDVMACITEGIVETAEMSAGADLSNVHEARYFRSVLSLRVVGGATSTQFNFKSYAMLVFRHLRQQFGWTTSQYLRSFGIEVAEDDGAFASNVMDMKGLVKESSGGGGSSGSMLFWSKDGRCMVKTVPRDELKLLMEILPRYHQYFVDNPDSLIVRFLGAHSIKMYGRKVYVVVMESVMPNHHPVHYKFDLKGSTVNRRVLSPSDELSPKSKVLKDLDWVHHIGTAYIPPSKYQKLKAQLEKDSSFLTALGIMDYSILAGVHSVNAAAAAAAATTDTSTVDGSEKELYTLRSDTSGGDVEGREGESVEGEGSSTVPAVTVTGLRQRHLHTLSLSTHATSSPRRNSADDLPFHQEYQGGVRAKGSVAGGEDYILYLGIIDILQEYNAKKKIERFFKHRVLFKNPDGISVIPPSAYAQRFMRFMSTIFAPAKNMEAGAGDGKKVRK